MTNLWRSGVILTIAGLVAGVGNYAFQGLIGRRLDKAEFGYVNSTLGFIALFGLPILIASTSVTHYIAHFRATGDEARLQGLLSGCRKFLIRLTLAGSVMALVLIQPLSSFFNFPRSSLMFAAMVCVLGGLWGTLASTLCQGMAWFSRLAFISVAAVVLRLSFGGLALTQWKVAEIGVLASGVALLANLFLLRWRKELAGSGPAVSPWNKEFVLFLTAGATCVGGSYCFTQADLLVAQRYFSGVDLGMYTAAGLLARALPLLVGPMLTVLFTSRSGHRTANALREQLKLLGLYAAGLIAGATVVLVLRNFFVRLIFGEYTPAAAEMVCQLAITMVFVALLQALGMWALASRWLKLAGLYGLSGLVYWLVLLRWGKSPALLLKLMPVGAGIALGLVFVGWLLVMRAAQRQQTVTSDPISNR